MPIAKYTQELMTQLLEHGEATERLQFMPTQKDYARAESRLRNAAMRANVSVRTERHSDCVKAFVN